MIPDLSRGKRKIFSRAKPRRKIQKLNLLRLPSTGLSPIHRLPIAHPSHTAQILHRSNVWEKYGRKTKWPRKPYHSTISGAVVELRGVAEVNLSTPDHAFFVPKSVKKGQNVARAVSLKHNWFFNRKKSMGEGMGGKSEFMRFIESQKHETESWSEGSGIDLVDRTEKRTVGIDWSF